MTIRQFLICFAAASLISGSLGCTFLNREKRKERTFNYVGCFKDQPKSRDLPIPGGHGLHMDSNECNLLCKKVKTTYMGLQEGGFCWCGNSFNKYGKADEIMCDEPCQGKPAEKCGSKDHNTIYETNFE